MAEGCQGRGASQTTAPELRAMVGGNRGGGEADISPNARGAEETQTENVSKSLEAGWRQEKAWQPGGPREASRGHRGCPPRSARDRVVPPPRGAAHVPLPLQQGLCNSHSAAGRLCLLSHDTAHPIHLEQHVPPSTLWDHPSNAQQPPSWRAAHQ